MKTAVITGGTSGIGKQTALALASEGWRLFICGRSAKKGEKAAEELRAAGAEVEFTALDMTDDEAVRSWAADIQNKVDYLDALVLNAGLVRYDLKYDKHDYEYMFATTHLGHFLLTHLLLSKVIAAVGRVVVTSSVAHWAASTTNPMAFKKGELNPSEFAAGFKAYGRSKLANILFVRGLNERLRHTGVYANAFHPGGVKTSIWRGMDKFAMALLNPFLISEKKGAQTQIWLASSSDIIEGGNYYTRKKMARTSAHASDLKKMQELWALSEKRFGIVEFGKPETDQSTEVRKQA